MKWILSLVLLISLNCFSQDSKPLKWISIAGNFYQVNDLFPPISGYTRIFRRDEFTSFAVDSALYVPRYNGTPSGVRVNENSAIDGLIAMDTTNSRLYIYSGGAWIRLASYAEAAGTGTVTSVGLSMPSAFTVGGSPVTTSGTLAVTGAGTTSQYIRGDGSLATYTGGGWGLSGNSITAGTDFLGTTNNAAMRFKTNNVEVAKLDSLGARLFLYGGLNPLVSLKQNTTSQEWQLRVGVNTGSSNSGFNIYDATTSKIRMHFNNIGNVAIGNVSTIPSISQLYVYGGASGANIDSRPDSTVNDETNIEAEHSDYDGVNRTGYGLAMRVWGNVGVGTTAMGYLKKNMSLLDFTNGTNLIRTLTNNSLRFGTNNIERMVLDSNGRVGIYKLAPEAFLHVGSSGSTTPAIIDAHEDVTGEILNVQQSAFKKFSLHSNGSMELNDVSTPSTPASGYGRVYVRADSLRFKNDVGTEFTMGTGGSSGITSLSAIGSSPNANGASISGVTLTLQPASASFGGLVTVGTQTFSGNKTLEGNLIFTPTGTDNRSIDFGTGYGVPALKLYSTTYGWGLAPSNMQFFMDASAKFTIQSTGAFDATGAAEDFKVDGANDYIRNSLNTAIGSGLVPTAKLHIAGGSATANTAPLKFTSGTNLTTAEAGAMEYNGTNLFFSPSTTRYTVDLSLTGSATLDFASTAAGAVSDLTITVTGAADGDVVTLGVPNGSVTATATYSAWVSAANTVTVRFSPKATEDPASGTFKVRVIK